MATLDVIRRLTLRAKAEGFNEAEKDVKSLGEAYETSARRQLSVEKTLQNLERRFITGAKAQQDFEKVQRQVNAVVAQNPALQARANAVLAEAHKRLLDAGQSGGALSKQFAVLNDQARSLAASLGPVGSLLLTLGPAGLAAGAALGTLAIGLGLAASEALKLADTAGKLKDLSDTTGLTVVQLQALEQAGAKVGLSAEQVTGNLERFTVQFDELQTASGGLYKALAQIDPALAQQAARAGSLAEAWDIVSKAIAKADESQRAALSKQAFGRGGISGSRLNLATFDAGGIAGIEAQLKNVDRITQQQAEHWDELGDAIAENTKIARQNIVSTFAGPTLESMKDVTAGLRTMSGVLKETDWSSGWGAFANAALTAIASVTPGINLIVSGMRLIKSATAPAPVAEAPGPGRFEQVFGDLAAMQGTTDKLAALRKAHQDAKAETIRNAEASKQYIQALSGTATPAEQLKDKILQLNAQVAKGEVTSDQAALATKRLNDEFRLNQAKGAVSALGNAATVAEQYAIKVQELSAQLAKGEINQQTFNRAVAGLKLDQTIAFMSANVSALGDAATQTEKYNLKVAQLSQSLSKGEISQDAFNRSVRQLDPALKAVQDTISEVGAALAQAFIEGANAAEALHRSLKAVASTAASATINNLIKGDLGAAAISGAVAVGSFALDQLFGGGDKKAQEEAAQKATEAMNQANESLKSVTESFNSLTAAADGATTATIKNAKAQFDQLKNAAESSRAAALTVVNTPGNTPAVMAQANANIAAANTAVLDATKRLADFNLRTINEALENFVSTDLSPIAQGLKDLTDKANDLAEALIITGRSAEEAAQLVDERLTQSLVMLSNKINTDLIRKIDEASGRGWVNQLKDLRAEIADLALGGGDAAKIAEYVRLTVQNIVDSGKLAGAEFANLLAAFPDLTGGIREFSEQAVVAADAIDNAAEVAAAAEQERVDAIKKANEDIVAYLNGLLTGSLSPLSAKAQLDSAKQLYEAQLALAQSGDLTALQDITKSADTLLNASKAFYGSSAGYQRDFTAIQGQLGSLAGGNAGILSPANDNVAAISAAGFTNMAVLLQQLVDLITSGNSSTEAISAAIATQTELLNQQTRFSDRGAA